MNESNVDRHYRLWKKYERAGAKAGKSRRQALLSRARRHRHNFSNNHTDINPIHMHNNKWWFWNEVWIDRMGPYETESEAKAACKKYAESI